MESQYKVCEVKLTYKSKIKASEREKILSAEDAYKILLSVFDSETIQYKEFFKGKSETPIFIYCKETYEHENEFNCRMFADALGVPEDPATGSANGCFAAYLSKYEILGTKKVNVKVEQGYEINRKSILHLRTQNESNKYNIEVGGKVIKVAEGHLE